ncbi:MAG: DUF3795 domain-containing protein [Syntrophomonadaceae bacterium]
MGGQRTYPTIGCCGIDCGLCPRFHTVGNSRCPGCGGEGFEQKHPSCSFITCCVKKHGLNICAECKEFPCRKFDKETGEHDSFVLHRRVIPNQRLIAEIGLEEFVHRQEIRLGFLGTAIAKHDDGRSKNLFCIAAALLSIDSLAAALSRAETGENLRTVLNELATAEKQELKLRK